MDSGIESGMEFGDGTGLESVDGTPHWSDYGSLGSTGALLDQAQSFMSDLQAHPVVPSPSVVETPFVPQVSGDTAALMSQIDTQLHQVDSIASGALDAPATGSGFSGGGFDGGGISPAAAQTMEMIQNTIAHPDRAAALGGLMQGEIARTGAGTDAFRHDEATALSDEINRPIEQTF